MAYPGRTRWPISSRCWRTSSACARRPRPTPTRDVLAATRGPSAPVEVIDDSSAPGGPIVFARHFSGPLALPQSHAIAARPTHRILWRDRCRSISITPGPGRGCNRPRNAPDSSEAELYLPKKWTRLAALQRLMEGEAGQERGERSIFYCARRRSAPTNATPRRMMSGTDGASTRPVGATRPTPGHQVRGSAGKGVPATDLAARRRICYPPGRKPMNQYRIRR